VISSTISLRNYKFYPKAELIIK